MAVYFALAHGRTHQGAFAECLAWGRGKSPPVQILRARPGEPMARVVAELAAGGVRVIADGRLAPSAKLRAAAKPP